ncbi:hypothetical protein B1R32_11243 [Abditibacterium utsteinense]|uniref:Uncharacterized protein n=1 Tax=Abditibacterium utsteinense TaxID=1960156 RepID=A0A2S8SRI3_9BACT|nr:hypothetical protein [Abditibacterium utsteinense]PQV63388.1 hypothetical protein B1R32_11243 [Abditibacterium utsteinense]
MSFRFSSYLLIPGALALSAAARADQTLLIEKRVESLQKSSVELSVARPISQREFADAASKEIGILASLRAWRDTLRGNGMQRTFQAAPLRGEKLGLSLGGVAPSEFGGGAGVAARWNRLEIGSTAKPQALEEVLAHFDSVLTGEKVAAPSQAMQLNWLRARLSESKNAQIDISMARASRDLPDSATQWRGGNFQQARANFKLPAQWSLSGNYGRAELENRAATKNEGKSDASAWGVDAAGPIAHPFGVATARANWREVGDGYAAPTDANGALGAKTGALEIAQELKIGRLSGNLRFGANTRERAETETARAGDELEQDQTQSAAQVRLALTPNLSFTGNGNWNSALTERALIDQNLALSTKNEANNDSQSNSENADAPDALITPAQARELSRQLAGDVGMQWNFSKALSLSVSLGTSSQDAHREIGDASQDGAQSDELRRALELRRKAGQSDFRLRFSQRARRDGVSTSNASGADISQWRMEAARQIIGNVRLKTIFDFSSDAKNDQNARRIEAQLQLARAARFDARYREGNLPSGLMSDEWSSVFEGANTAPKQWSARFGAGSAASGAGLGLAVEVARSQGNVPDLWRVGVQFK